MVLYAQTAIFVLVLIIRVAFIKYGVLKMLKHGLMQAELRELWTTPDWLASLLVERRDVLSNTLLVLQLMAILVGVLGECLS